MAILVHTIGMVARNLGVAIRISGVLMALQFVLAIFMGAQFLNMAGGGATPMPVSAGAMGALALLSLVQVVSALWIAVAWHRFILTDERPTGILPPIHGGAMLSYLWAAILCTLVLILVALPFVLLSGLLFAPMVMHSRGPTLSGELIAFFLVWLPTTYVALRISPVLPSAALGNRLPLREAWYATGTSGMAFAVLALISGAAAWILHLPVLLLGRISTFLAIAWNFGAQWLMLIVGIGLLTTIYGHYVEKRALND